MMKLKVHFSCLQAAFADYTSQMVLASLAEQPERRQAAQHTKTAVLLLGESAAAGPFDADACS